MQEMAETAAVEQQQEGSVQLSVQSQRSQTEQQNPEIVQAPRLF